MFDDATSARDIVVYSGSDLYVFSGTQLPPPFTLPAAPPAASLSMSFAEMVLVAATTDLPVGALVLFGLVYVRRRRRKGE